jgi:hypothetical protein
MTMKCQPCKTRNAVWVTGSDGFSSKSGSKVCDDFVCRSWASGGYPVTFRRVTKAMSTHGKDAR